MAPALQEPSCSVPGMSTEAEDCKKASSPNQQEDNPQAGVSLLTAGSEGRDPDEEMVQSN